MTLHKEKTHNQFYDDNRESYSGPVKIYNKEEIDALNKERK